MMLLDFFVEQFLGCCTDPVETAFRFLLVVLVFDSIFGLINNLLNVNRK